MRRKCETGAYNGPEAFAADMRLVFSNAHTYNKAGTDVYVMATTLSVRFLIRAILRWWSVELCLIALQR